MRISFLVLALLFAAPLYADEAKTSEGMSCKEHCDHKEGCSDKESCCKGGCRGRYRNKGYAIEIVPKFYFLKDNGFAPAFTANGYAAPSKTQLGGDIRLYGIGKDGWQGGFDLSGLDFSNDGPGGNTAFSSYRDAYGGLWIAKAFTVLPSFEATVGSVLGFGITNVESLGTTVNGRIREFAMVVEPTVSFSYRLCNRAKIGVMASYLLPFLRSADIKGQDLGFRNVSAQGFSAGLQLVLGRFEPLAMEEEK